MTSASRAAVEAELRACRGYVDKHVTRLVCRMIDSAVRAESRRQRSRIAELERDLLTAETVARELVRVSNIKVRA